MLRFFSVANRSDRFAKDLIVTQTKSSQRISTNKESANKSNIKISKKKKKTDSNQFFVFFVPISSSFFDVQFCSSARI